MTDTIDTTLPTLLHCFQWRKLQLFAPSGFWCCFSQCL